MSWIVAVAVVLAGVVGIGPGNGPSYRIVVILVQHFVGLQVDTPATAAVCQGHVGLLRKDASALPQRLVPHRIHDADLGVGDAAHQLACSVLGVTHGHYKFVDQWQHRPDGFNDGIVVHDGIANERKARDHHATSAPFTQTLHTWLTPKW